MTNLLEETVEILNKHGLTLDDILYIKTSEGDFLAKNGGRKFLNVDYTNYCGNEIDPNLKCVGHGWWLERHTCDDSEWWEYKEPPMFIKAGHYIKSPLISQQ